MTDDIRKKAVPVCFVGAGPGNPGLLTVRGQQLLREAELVVYDTGLGKGFLDGCAEDCHVIDAGLEDSTSSESSQTLAAKMIEAARRGQRVVRLKSGDPLFHSRALHELQHLRAADIPVEIVPGVASPLGAAATTGVPLTGAHGLQKLVFVSATDWLNRTIDASDLSALANASDTLCVTLVGAQLHAIVHALLKQERFRHARALLVHGATLPEQRVIDAPLPELEARATMHPQNEPCFLILGDGLRHRDALNWFESRPLFGKRLLLCRASGQARDSAAAIMNRGASVELLPLIEVSSIENDRALLDCVNRVREADWVIFTSSNGVESFRRVVIESQMDARVFGQARIAVIGPGTAKPLAAWGLRPDLVAKEHVAEALAREILDCGPVKRVMLIRAMEARDALPTALRAAGIDVEIVPAYRTRKIGSAERDRLVHLLRSRAVDAVLLTSSSMVDSLVAALGGETLDLLSNVCVASIGPITTATLERHGVNPTVTASSFTIDGLLNDLEAFFTRYKSLT